MVDKKPQHSHVCRAWAHRVCGRIAFPEATHRAVADHSPAEVASVESESGLAQNGGALLLTALKCMLAGAPQLALKHYLPGAHVFLLRAIETREWSRGIPSVPSDEYGEYEVRSQLDMVEASHPASNARHVVRERTVALLDGDFAQHVRSFRGEGRQVPQGTEHRAVMRACAAGCYDTAARWWAEIDRAGVSATTPLGTVGKACADFARLTLAEDHGGAQRAVQSVYEQAIRWDGFLWQAILIDDVVVLGWLVHAGPVQRQAKTMLEVADCIADDTWRLYRQCCLNRTEFPHDAE